MYEIDKVKFGEFVSELRKEKGITQKELAGKLYISDKAVSKWETGHSVPDITLLVPLAEILEVSVTELLECRRIEQADTLDMEQADKLVKKVIGLSEEENQKRPQFTKKKVMIFLACALAGCLEIFALYQMEHAYFFQFGAIMMVGMSMFFGVYFWFFMKERLPAYYDENKINVYIDGVMHMNMPGVYFNNHNWPHIMKALRIWSAAGMSVFPVLYVVLSSIFSAFRPEADVFILLFLMLGGLFIPVYVQANRYRYSDCEKAEEKEKRLKKSLLLSVVIVAVLGVLFATGSIRGRVGLTTRVACTENSTKNIWSMEYMFCDGFMQRTMWTEDDEESFSVVVETEEGTIAIRIEDRDGNVIFDETNIQTGTYEVEASGKYKVRVEMEDHKGSFYIGN